MRVGRRAFVQQATAAAVATVLAPVVGRASAAAPATRRAEPVRAVLLDAFAVFDPGSVGALCEREVPGRGAELMAAWRARQFEYTWLRIAMGEYADFWRCTDDALRFAAASLRIDLAPAQRARLMSAYLALRPWPDAPAALRRLRAAGVRLGFLSNFTPTMLDAAIGGSGLADVFECALSTDRVRSYKPDPRAYRLGVDALRLPRERTVFAAFAGWDAVGARRFGYPTFWVNRLQAPPEELGTAPPDGTGRTLDELVSFVETRR